MHICSIIKFYSTVQWLRWSVTILWRKRQWGMIYGLKASISLYFQQDMNFLNEVWTTVSHKALLFQTYLGMLNIQEDFQLKWSGLVGDFQTCTSYSSSEISCHHLWRLWCCWIHTHDVISDHIIDKHWTECRITIKHRVANVIRLTTLKWSQIWQAFVEGDSIFLFAQYSSRTMPWILTDCVLFAYSSHQSNLSGEEGCTIIHVTKWFFFCGMELVVSILRLFQFLKPKLY